MPRNTSMTSLQDALFRIEPTRGLVSYTNDVKPYHSKILDVLIEYVYEERINATVNEKWKWEIHWDERWDDNRDAAWLANRKPPKVQYSCGYGLVWDGTSSADMNPPVTIAHISPAHYQVLGITPTNGTVKAMLKVSGNGILDFPAGSVFRLDGSSYSKSSNTVPSNINTFTVFGTPVYVNGQTIITISETLLPVVDPVFGNIYAMVDRMDTALQPPANSFLVSTPVTYNYDFAVHNPDSNQLVIVDRVPIVGVNPSGKTWTIQGNKIDDVDIGSKIHVTSNSTNTNKQYTVTDVTLVSGNTRISVYEPIFTTATSTGFLAIPIKPLNTYNIININTSTNQITISGAHIAGMIPNTEFTIVGNGTQDILHPEYSADGRYIILSAVESAGNTIITTKSQVITTALNGGVVQIVRLPGWASGTQIKLSGAGVQPVPLETASDYYFHPHTTPGIFNLAYKRYPNKSVDIVNILSSGVGIIQIARGELYYPGASIRTDHTTKSLNRRIYYVKSTVVEGAYTRVYVMQHIESPHGGPSGFAGTMTLSGSGYDEISYCPLSSAPALYADTYVHEHLQFTVEMFSRDNISTGIFENKIQDGWGISEYSLGVSGPYGGIGGDQDIPQRFALTSGNPPMDGAHTILPTGYDTQLWDIGGMDESYVNVKNFYGRSLPPPPP